MRILIVDDEIEIRKVLRLLLENAGHEIVEASDGERAVTSVRDDRSIDPNLASCDAVKNGRVYQMPSKSEAWDSPVPSGILGAVWLSSVLHPTECPEAEVNATIDSFYKTFYGFTYSET